jgi:Na+:H+ antiporter, NhaA family
LTEDEGPAARFSRFLRIETAAGAVLLASTLVALVLSNSRWADEFLALWETHIGFQIGSREVVRSVKEWINDGLMTLFFFLVALELKRELVLGELGHPRVAALSIAAAVGGMLVPAAFYLLLQSGQPGAAGWGTVMATDTAFVIGCLALLGSRIPPSLRVFMLSLAITDDIGAILVVGHRLQQSRGVVGADVRHRRVRRRARHGDAGHSQRAALLPRRRGD